MMPMPLWLADTIARLAQRGPGPTPAERVTFAHVPADTSDITIPTRNGEIAATVYAPPGGVTDAPVYVNFHGGGFVLRHPEQDDGLCRVLADRAGVVVVNVDYDVAPQLRSPGQSEQVFDAVTWAAAPEREWDGSRLAVGGASAGAAHAVAASRLALEQGGPEIRLQVLLYPPLDLTVPSKRKWSPGKEKMLVHMGPIFDRSYRPEASERGDRLVSPAGAQDRASIEGIAPAVMVTCERDILREEAVRYAARLRAAGSLREHLDLPGVGHGFNLLGDDGELVDRVYDTIAGHLSATIHLTSE